MTHRIIKFRTPNGQVVLIDCEKEEIEEVENLCESFFTKEILYSGNKWHVDWTDIEIQARVNTELRLDPEFENWCYGANPRIKEAIDKFPEFAPIKPNGAEICTV